MATNNPSEPEKTLARVEQWKRRLLDLTLRNRLVSVRDGKHLLPLDEPDVVKLEDRLASAGEIPVASTLSPAETQKRVKEIYNAGRTAVEESGVNSVFVAVGFLEWNGEKAGGAARRAPILLVPVRLARTTATSGYRYSRLDEDARVNTTLVEFLKAEFSLAVPGLDPLPQDASGTDVEAVFAAFEEAVAGRGWRVVREAALGFFSFGKIALWQDLSTRVDDLRRNPLVEHMLTGGGSVYDDGVAVFPPDEIARHLDPEKLWCPLGADASQLTAVLYSALGKTFVLHGPPGTGKSQTITNLIVHNLALGRSVLFVSEKKAALDVVYRRLKNVGVGPFCLELHSNRAGKGAVLAQLAEAMEFPATGEPAGHGGVCVTLENNRDKLTGYVKALHAVRKNGMTAYDCLSRADGDPAVSADLVRVTALADTPAEAEARADLARDLAAEWATQDAAAYRALRPVLAEEWTPEVEDAAKTALGRLRDAYAATGPVAWLKRRWTAFRLRKTVSFDDSPAPDEAVRRLDAALEALPSLRLSATYRAKRRAADESGLAAFATALEDGRFAAEAAARVYTGSYAAKTLKEILAVSPDLARFSGVSHEDTIRKFREADALYAETAKRAAIARIAARLPAGRALDCPDKSELGVLKRECAKRTRQKPVRQLLEEIPGIVRALKPCFLMSPQSVSQYLPPDGAPFDLVVFDEASQIPVWDAVGPIARGRQLVVVGDPKQMPPTNFFNKGDSADDEEAATETVEDMESILDEALAMGLHSAYLNWHYRSRHEALISFSNSHYYDDRLNTFPAAAESSDLGVAFRFVDGGVYDARGKRTNRKEAEAIVDWVFGEASRKDAKPRSVGVVAFSIAQKSLIEELIESRAAEHPELAAFFDDSAEDPFFVKNLENVQGDERDVIVFSVGYAPDAKGDFAMNFGPLNRQGGERRLNVAVTRAREQIYVFSSVHAAQIDLNRTKAVGAAHLKEFLEYAERGGAPCARRDAAEGETAIGEVAAFLETNGYAVEFAVGASDRRIDLGVKRREGGYLLAILTDGPTYGGDLTVRDRDAQRVSVLQSLGWNVFRLWSVDWRLDRARTEARLLEILKNLSSGVAGAYPPPVTPDPAYAKAALRPVAAKSATPTVPSVRRDVETVPDAELFALRDAVVKDFGVCPKDVVYREIAARLGYKALSQKARAYLESRLG